MHTIAPGMQLYYDVICKYASQVLLRAILTWTGGDCRIPVSTLGRLGVDIAKGIGGLTCTGDSSLRVAIGATLVFRNATVFCHLSLNFGNSSITLAQSKHM